MKIFCPRVLSGNKRRHRQQAEGSAYIQKGRFDIVYPAGGKKKSFHQDTLLSPAESFEFSPIAGRTEGAFDCDAIIWTCGLDLG